MPDRASTDVDVASRALVMIGTKPITSFGDSTTEAQAAAIIYEDIVTQVLTSTRWRFAASQERINRETTDPQSKWEAAYRLPTNCLAIITVRNGDIEVPFDRYGDQIYSAAYDELIIDFIRRVPTVDWPPYFTLPVIHLLASELAIAVAQNEQLSALHAEKYEMFGSKGRTMDAQGRTASVLNLKRYEAHRR